MKKWATEWGQFVTLLVVVVGATIAMFAWGFAVLRADIDRLESGLRADIARLESELRADIARVESRVDENRQAVLANQRETTALVREVSELRGELRGRDLIAGTEDNES